MGNLIQRLNSLVTKTPDEIINSLKPNPWQQLGHMSRGFYDENRDLRIVLYNVDDEEYMDDQGRHESLSDVSEPRRLGSWGSRVFCEGYNRYWYWAPFDQVIPFEHGVHDAARNS